MKYVVEKDLCKAGQTDYVRNGELHSVGIASAVMISSSDDLAELSTHYPPGTLAYTPGFRDMWQLNAEANWISIL